MTEQALAERLTNDLKAAMRSGDTERREVIRYLRSAIHNREIELRHPLSDEEIIGVIQTQVKQRQDSAEVYRNGGREDLASKEEQEIQVLSDYLPEQLSESELEALARRLADEHGLSGPADMRVLMPALQEAAGAKADGRTLSRVASAELKRRAGAG